MTEEFRRLLNKSNELFDDPSLKKKNMNEEQQRTLLIFEQAEAQKLSTIAENSLGFQGCMESISATANLTKKFIEDVMNTRPA
jgi:hypothetical protein